MKQEIETTQQSEKEGVETHVAKGPMTEMAAYQPIQLVLLDAAAIILQRLQKTIGMVSEYRKRT